MKILVTGSAGFIGSHTTHALLDRGDEVVGLDNFNDYYDPTLKEARNARLEERDGYTLIRGDIRDRDTVKQAMEGVDRVCHLAAMAGVRYSFEHPEKYVNTNVNGTFNIFDEARLQGIEGVIYASSSSVYGGNKEFPAKEVHETNDQLALYGATKRMTEIMAHTYHHLYGLHTTGLRFFTVYGPWGRPDMSLFIFTKKILAGEPIEIFGEGNMIRDFTYIDDIVTGVLGAIDLNAEEEIFNLGRGKKEELMDFVCTVEKACGKEAEKNFLPMQPGDIRMTSAGIDHAKERIGFDPQTTIAEGVPKFVEWYKEYYGV